MIESKRNHLLNRLSAIALLFMIVGTVKAADHYVDPSTDQKIQDVLDGVSDGDVVILKDGLYKGEGNRGLQIPDGVRRLTLRAENHAGRCIVDAEHQDLILLAGGVDLSVKGITFRNGLSENGGAIYCQGGKLNVYDCEFIGNIAENSGGALFSQNVRDIEISNCLFALNNAVRGAGIYSSFADTIKILHSTFHRNDSVAVYSEYCDQIDVLYSILWKNQQAIVQTHGEPRVEYSNSDTWFSGNNLKSNPLFVSAIYGDHYLAQVNAGYSVDSPCVDAFKELSVDDFPAVKDRTTSPYHFPDVGALDLGYHYVPFQAFVTPTPTPTPTPSRTPTETPTPTGTPTATPVYEIVLALNDTIFKPGSTFKLDLCVNNRIARTNPLRLFVVLDVYGWFFFHPSWTERFEFEYVTIPVGQFGITIMEFEWPSKCGSADGLMFHAAFLDRDGQYIIHAGDDLLSGIASVVFSYSE